MTALVDACDRYGNPTVFKGETVTVSASGPAHMPQERAFEVADMRWRSCHFANDLPKSWKLRRPRCHRWYSHCCIALGITRKFPGPCDRTSDVARRRFSWASWRSSARLTVQTEDKYGNNCHGGDRVDLNIVSSDGNKSTCLDVHDHGDGSYTAEFVVPTAGGIRVLLSLTVKSPKNLRSN